MGCVPGDGKEVDHKDFDRLNCRRSNLRVGTPAENRRNRRGNKGTTRGTFFWSERGKWVAQASVGRRGEAKRHFLGYFDTEGEAATGVAEFWEARDAA